MEPVIIIPRESLICSICYELLENPLQCTFCSNLFCDCCIKEYINTKDKYRRLYYCPLCRSKKNSFCENSKINELIEDFKKSGKKLCPKCKIVIEQEEYQNHINQCWYKCKLCHSIFPQDNKFLEHFSHHSKSKLEMLLSKFNRKDGLKNKSNKSSENEHERVKREKFQNNLPKKEEDKENADLQIIDKFSFNKNYNLFFCGKDNGIKCKCCINHTCSPEGELCQNCMKKNIKYHNLKHHYLINKKGKACKYSNGSFHCFTKTEAIRQDKGGNYFREYKICFKEYTCEACKNITDLMHYYLPQSIIKKLVERDYKSNK